MLYYRNYKGICRAEQIIYLTRDYMVDTTQKIGENDHF